MDLKIIGDGRIRQAVFTETLEVEETRERGYPGFGPGDPPGYVHSEFYDQAVEMLRAHGAKRVLDAACGGGYGVSILRKAGFEVWGVDINPTAVRYAQLYNPGANIVCASLDDLPFRDRWFDGVVSIESIEHIARPADALWQFYRVLDRGLLYLTTPLRGFVPPSPFHVRELDEFELDDALDDLDLYVRRHPRADMPGVQIVTAQT